MLISTAHCLAFQLPDPIFHQMLGEFAALLASYPTSAYKLCSNLLSLATKCNHSYWPPDHPAVPIFEVSDDLTEASDVSLLYLAQQVRFTFLHYF